MDTFNEELPALRKSACFEDMDQIANPLPRREVSTNSSQRSNVSSCQRIEYSGEKFAVGEPAVSVELGNMKTNSSQLQENPCDGETDEKWSSNDVNCIGARSSGNMAVVADKSMMAEKESQETEQSDKSWGITHPAIKLLGNHIVMNRTGNDTIGTDNFKRSEKEVEETENSNILDIHSSVNQLDNCVHVDYIGEEGIDIDNSMRVEKEVEDTDKSDTCEITYSTIKELRNSINANSSGKETIGADNSKRITKLVEDTEKFDKSCKTIHLTVKTLSNENSEDSKENPTNEHQISSFTPGKRQKMGEHGIVMNFQKDGDETKNADVPIQVYHHQKRKISMESDACASACGGINVEGAGTPNSNTGEIREGLVTGNDINWTIPSNLNTTHVADSFEPNDRNIETLRASLASKDIAITQAALGVLYRKMAKLCQQHQLIQDDIALCDRNIQNILQGNEGASTLKVDSTMDGCKDTCFSDKIQDESYQHGEGHDLIQSTKGKGIPDAMLYLRSPRQMADAGDQGGEKTKKTGKKQMRGSVTAAGVSAQVPPPPYSQASQTQQTNAHIPELIPTVNLRAMCHASPSTSQQNPQAQQIPQPLLHQAQSNPLFVSSPAGGLRTAASSSSAVGNDADDTLIWIEPDGDGFWPHKPAIEGIAACIKTKFEEGKPSWKKFSTATRDMWFEEFQKKFRWPPRHNAAVRENFEKRGAGRLAQMLQKVRKDGRKPSWMGDSTWADLNKYWQSQEFKQKFDQNKKNRDSNAGASLHTGGSIPHRVHFKKMKAERGENPPFSDFYFRTHKKKEGDWVHPRAQAAYDNFEKKKAEISSQSTVENDNMSSDGSQHSQHLPSDLDIWYDAVGGKKKGRVSGLGSLGRTMKGYSSRPSHPYDLPEDVDERIRSTVHSLSAELQAQLERERLEKEEMKKEQASLQAQLSETRNQLHTLMERLGVLPGSSRHQRSPPLDADGSSDD